MYGLILNRVRGQEMMIGTYVGFSIVSAMCMFWILAPFKNPEMIWVISGKGLRTTLPVSDSLAQVLDKLWEFSIFGMKVPTGLLLTFALAYLLLGIFNRTKLGISMRIAGANPSFAMSCGINVDKMRILGTVLSTALGAMGMVIYCQSLGLVQPVQGSADDGVSGGCRSPNRRCQRQKSHCLALRPGYGPVPDAPDHRFACDPERHRRRYL